MTQGVDDAVRRAPGRALAGLALFLLTATALAGDPAPPPPSAARGLALEGREIALEFAGDSEGLGVLSIENRAGPGAPERFASAEPSSALLWRIVLRKPGGSGDPVAIDNRAPSKRSASLDRAAGRLALRWEGIALPASGEGGGTGPAPPGGEAKSPSAESLDVEVDVSLAPRGAESRWSLRVANRSARLGLWEVHFPLFGGFGRKGALDVAVPRGNWGVLERGVASGLSGTYPSNDWPLQCVLFGAGGRWLGLYVEDPRAQPKRFALEPGGELAVVLHPEDMGVPGRGFQSPSVAIDAFRGSWWAGAKRYRRWALSAPWSVRGAIAERKDFPESLRRTALWWLASGAAADVVPKMREAAARFDVPLAVHWYNWHEIPFDVDYPEYFPAKPGFAEGVRELAAMGVVSMPYINGRLWDVAGRNFPAARPAAAKKPGGEEVYIETYGSGAKLAPMCPATRLWQEKVGEIARRLFEECGVGAIYIDQIASAAPVLCHDPSHGHPLGGGSHWVDGYRKMLEPIRDSAARRGAFLTTENNAEPYMDAIDAFLVWLPRRGDEIPLVPAVYGGRTVYFSSPARGGMEPDAFSALQGRDLLWGCQLGWMGFELLAPERKEQADYLLECARYRRALEKFLLEGELLGELELEVPPPPVEVAWGGWTGVQPARLPSVATAIWRAPDGSSALLAANLSSEPRAIAYAFDPGVGAWRLARIRPSGRENLGEVSGPFRREDRLGPREIFALAVEAR
ncbi:MAG: DUF6259 domain-containing protein [Planctomycetota bacterium]